MAPKYKAVVWTGIHKLEIVYKEIPIPGPGEILLKVRSAGICGTDLHVLAGKHPTAKPPRVLGHEFAGQVADVGKGVDSQLIGARVGSDSYIGCGKCNYCMSKNTQLCEKGTKELGFDLDGGWAEYVLVPAMNIYFLPDEVSFIEGGAGCILNCPLAAIETIKVEAGDTVLILGDGPSSLIMVQLARYKGARNVIISGHRPKRLSLAIKLGADKAVDTNIENLDDVIESFSSPPNVVIDAVGKSETFSKALMYAGKRARIHIFGLPEEPLNDIPLDLFLWKELTLKSSTGAPSLWGDAMNLISKKLLKVKPIISHKFALEDAQEAFEFIRNNRKDVIKAVFEVN